MLDRRGRGAPRGEAPAALSASRLAIRRPILGAKELRSIRDPDTHELTGEIDGFEVPGGSEIPEIHGVAVDTWLPLEFFKLDEDTFEAAGLLPNGEQLDVFVSDDQLASFEDSILLDLGEYISLIVRAYGSPKARFALLVDEALPEFRTKSYSLDDIIANMTSGERSVEEAAHLFGLK